jgi:hypothetical protein
MKVSSTKGIVWDLLKPGCWETVYTHELRVFVIEKAYNQRASCGLNLVFHSTCVHHAREFINWDKNTMISFYSK